MVWLGSRCFGTHKGQGLRYGSERGWMDAAVRGLGGSGFNGRRCSGDVPAGVTCGTWGCYGGGGLDGDGL